MYPKGAARPVHRTGASLGVGPVAKRAFERSNPRMRNDGYAALVERELKLLRPGGQPGAITPRMGFFLSSFQKWQEDILLKEATPTVFADLGYGALDSAMVETAAYCLAKSPAPEKAAVAVD